MKLKEKIDSLAEKRLNARFQKLVRDGLLARDVAAVKMKKERDSFCCALVKIKFMQLFAQALVNKRM